MNSRWKNPGLYLSLFAIIFLVIQDTGVLHIEASRYELYVNYIMTFLALAGVVSNPKEGKFYFDVKDKNEQIEED